MNNKTCIHHTDKERENLECPVCLKKERDAAIKQLGEWSAIAGKVESEYMSKCAEVVKLSSQLASMTVDRNECIALANDLKQANETMQARHDAIKSLLKEWMEHDVQDGRALEIVDQVRAWCESAQIKP